MKVNCVILLAMAAMLSATQAAGPTPCDGARMYELTIDFNWSKETHTNLCPADAAFSPVVAAAHDEFYNVFSLDDYSTRGVQRFAETGEPVVLMKELERLLERDVSSVDSNSWPTETGVEQVKLRLKLRDIRYRVSFMAQLVNSPDWFSGIDSISMCDQSKGAWVQSRHGVLSVYDAGTDNGAVFGAEQQPNHRLQPIKDKLEGRFSGVPVGKWSIDLV